VICFNISRRNSVGRLTLDLTELANKLHFVRRKLRANGRIRAAGAGVFSSMSGKRYFAIVTGTGLIVLGIVLFAPFLNERALAITGAVITQDANPARQLPIADARIQVKAGQFTVTGNSDNSGYFKIVLPTNVRKGQRLELQVRHPEYQPADWSGSVQERLYVQRLLPIGGAAEAPQPSPPEMKIENIVARYSINTTNAVNVGSAVKTFEVVNKGDVPCDGRAPCSPDGQWKAAIGTEELHAGPGNEFHNARASCIAGPCPFTRIEENNFAHDSPTLHVSVLNWSDTATFLLEAEVYHTTVTTFIRQSYPFIFERGLTFTLPAAAEGVSIEAQVNGAPIVFPLGPALRLTWARCQMVVNKDGTRVYRCELKPGYRIP